jgi:formamidopyrimidine-DNA glycosylase
MPELPEVEAVVRSIRPLLVGRTIRRARVVHGVAVRPQQPAVFIANLRGQEIRGVERHGKYLVVNLGEGCLVIHFRLDGLLLWRPEGASWPKNAHLDVFLELDRGELGFVDRRHFGRALFFPKLENCSGIARLGADPLGQGFTAEKLFATLQASRCPLKPFLMDQSRIAGLGNIYSCEALWRARLSPFRATHRVSRQHARALHKAIVAILRRALECCLTPPPSFRDPSWWFQGLEKIERVYGREGKPCRRADGRVRRRQQGGRSTFYCPGCQT